MKYVVKVNTDMYKEAGASASVTLTTGKGKLSKYHVESQSTKVNVKQEPQDK